MNYNYLYSVTKVTQKQFLKGTENDTNKKNKKKIQRQ